MTKTITTLPALVVAEIDGEPRVLDTALAEQLGMANPRAIRLLIEEHRDELEAFGVLSATLTKSSDALGRGRPGRAFYLNREQALLICILSKTPKAKEVRAEVIRVFTAWTRGELVEAPKAPVLPNFNNAAEAARAWADRWEGEQKALATIKVLEPLAAVAERVVAKKRRLKEVAATLPGVNISAIHKDLLAADILCQPHGKYRVRSGHRDKTFAMGYEDAYGNSVIEVLPAGYPLLNTLYHAGRLTMKAKCKPVKGFKLTA